MSTHGRPIDTAAVAIIDKPAGSTSHDVVQRVRRLLSERRVGHAGTLDPMATGVLVVMVGPATKLGPYLSADRKRYRATVCFGVGTDTLDADGRVTARAELPGWWADVGVRAARLEAALRQERARRWQQPPAFCAIKVDGRRAYQRARAGLPVELAPRGVEVYELDLRAPSARPAGVPATEQRRVEPTGEGRVELELAVSKGYYVRALARDLGLSLDLPAHLTGLRRTASGAFHEGLAVDLDTDPERLQASLLGLDEAARLAMPSATLTELGVARAACGQPLGPQHFASAAPSDTPTAWFDPAGHLVAVGQSLTDGAARVLRGFAATCCASARPPIR